MRGAVHIGTSGFHYKHWRGPFYPEKLPPTKWLEFYQQHFDTVELNNTFYRLPSPTALTAWRDTTPPHFCFAAKGSRFITHMKKLKDPDLALSRYFERVDILGSKLGPIVFQLPPFWEVDLARLEGFLQALPGYHRYAFEFRNPTWHSQAVYDLLRGHNAAFCAFDLAGFQSPLEITTDFAYVRLHGPGGAYQGSYSQEALEAWARRIEDWRGRLKAVYIYFDNDMAGYAAQNAAALRLMSQ